MGKKRTIVATARKLAGQSEPQLHISKEGDPYLRTLVQGAQHILGPFGVDCDLRRWGLKLAERGGRNHLIWLQQLRIRPDFQGDFLEQSLGFADYRSQLSPLTPAGVQSKQEHGFRSDTG